MWFLSMRRPMRSASVILVFALTCTRSRSSPGCLSDGRCGGTPGIPVSAAGQVRLRHLWRRLSHYRRRGGRVGRRWSKCADRLWTGDRQWTGVRHGPAPIAARSARARGTVWNRAWRCRVAAIETRTRADATREPAAAGPASALSILAPSPGRPGRHWAIAARALRAFGLACGLRISFT
jgi:hypothetical protein